MECPFCKLIDNLKVPDVPEWDEPSTHLVVTVNGEGKSHVHGPTYSKEMFEYLIHCAVYTYESQFKVPYIEALKRVKKLQQQELGAKKSLKIPKRQLLL